MAIMNIRFMLCDKLGYRGRNMCLAVLPHIVLEFGIIMKKAKDFEPGKKGLGKGKPGFEIHHLLA
jgi:hypothetical protein